jgi:hypothetical protein
MDLKGLQRKAKELFDKRGGSEALKADAEELRDIAKDQGTLSDKAKRAGEALKEPGAKGADTPPAAPPAPPPDSP